LWIPQDDGIAVRIRCEKGHVALIGDQGVDSLHHALRLVDAGDGGAVNRAHHGERFRVGAQRASEIAARREDRIRVRRMAQTDVADQQRGETVQQARFGFELRNFQQARRNSHIQIELIALTAVG
jgi:hypothetical protein